MDDLSSTANQLRLPPNQQIDQYTTLFGFLGLGGCLIQASQLWSFSCTICRCTQFPSCFCFFFFLLLLLLNRTARISALAEGHRMAQDGLSPLFCLLYCKWLMDMSRCTHDQEHILIHALLWYCVITFNYCNHSCENINNCALHISIITNQLV